jgi:hypothetical protein
MALPTPPPPALTAAWQGWVGVDGVAKNREIATIVTAEPGGALDHGLQN